MRSKHTLSALLASALLFAGAGSALAASVQIVLPEETVPGGSRAQLTVTTDVPGFLTLTLDGPSGSVTLCENQEVHTADNTLIFTVSDEDGAPLDVGAYTVNGELIDQFGQTAARLSGPSASPPRRWRTRQIPTRFPPMKRPPTPNSRLNRLPSPPQPSLPPLKRPQAAMWNTSLRLRPSWATKAMKSA